MSEAAIRQAFTDQAGWCHRMASPFTALLMEVLAERLNPSTEIGRRLCAWPGNPGPDGDIVPLRLAGALHALVLRGDTPYLAKLYPPNTQPDADSLWLELRPVLINQAAAIHPFLDVAPQTNEVGRAAPLMVGLLTVTAETKLPMALFEVGASAGLNLNLKRYRYDLGGMIVGDPDSAVRLAPAWTGNLPKSGAIHIMRTHGVDLQPLSALDSADREKLMGYVWADQTDRLARLKAALDLAQIYPPKVDRGDAGEWAEATLAIEPELAMTRVLYHTVAFQYFPPATQNRLVAHIGKIGAKATPSGPFAWLRYEADPEFDNAMSLRLTLWPNGEERVLGVGQGHGNSFKLL